jgi:ATP-binding protein involved in chromosome partitioning
VRGLSIRGSRVVFMLEVPAGDIDLYRPVRDQAEEALALVDGVETAQVVLTAEAATPSDFRVAPRGPAPPDLRVAPRRARVAEDPGAKLAPMPDAERAPHVKKVIAIASGKGGVGKSTVAVNLAVALAELGYRAGLLDADIYGPSAPTMLGVNGDQSFNAQKQLIPMEAWGVKVTSIGFIVEPGTANIWRGPMASSALRSLMNAAWGTAEEPLDVLVVDLPPGTGDIQLTLIQRLVLDGVVIVSTPQEIALIDARRAAEMFRKTETKILGMVENMAFFVDAAGARGADLRRRAARRPKPSASACRCWPRCRWRRGCARPATPAGRSSPPTLRAPRRRPSCRWRGRSASLRRHVLARPAQDLHRGRVVSRLQLVERLADSRSGGRRRACSPAGRPSRSVTRMIGAKT